jgi:F-type H+-transporting ATPase subunit delta
MNDGKISIRYARALFDIALERKILDRVYEDMKFISEMSALPEMKEFLYSPIIRPSKKSDILHKVIGKNIDSLSLSFIDMIVNNERESFLPSIARAFIHETKEYNGITESVLTTAIPVDAKVRKQIIDLISGIFKTKVELKEIIDKEIIGGFILRVEDSYIDASVKNKLRKIEKELKGNTLATGR